MTNVLISYMFDIKLIIIILVLYILYKWGTRKYNLHLKLGCKGPIPLPFLGNMVSFALLGIHEYDKQCLKKFGRIYPTYMGGVAVTIVSDEVLLKQILIKDFKCFSDRLDIGVKSKNTEKMLTMLNGKDWERVRNLITPTFTSGKLKKMSPLLANCIDLLMKRLRECPPDSYIDIKEFFGALTMDAIARTMFGMEIDSQRNSENLFMVNAKKIFDVSLFSPINFLAVVFPSFRKLILTFNPEWDMLGQEPMAFFKTNIQKAINERKASTEQYNDFLALMLKVDNEEKEDKENSSLNSDTKYLTPQEIAAQSLIFLIAGYETTATTLTWASYFLAKNPDTQQELYEELIETVGIEGEITYEALMKMHLLDGCINETLRICPPALRFDRECSEDVDLMSSDNKIIHVEKGDVFSVPIYAIHTDPRIWPDPDVFDIHRFDPENKKDRSAYTFMPFGMGPRNCVGMRFALLEMKWALASILKDFELRCCDRTQNTIKFKNFGFAQPIKPLIIKIKARE